MTRLVIWTIPWALDHEAEPGEELSGQVRCRVFLDGNEVKDVVSVNTHSDAGFTSATIEISPGSIEFLPVSEADFYADDDGEPFDRSSEQSRNGADEIISDITTEADA